MNNIKQLKREITNDESLQIEQIAMCDFNDEPRTEYILVPCKRDESWIKIKGKHYKSTDRIPKGPAFIRDDFVKKSIKSTKNI